MYSTTIIDIFNRKIIGWSLSNGMSTDQTSLSAWKIEMKNRNLTTGLVFYSDRGTQYENHKFATMLESYKVTRSNIINCENY